MLPCGKYKRENRPKYSLEFNWRRIERHVGGRERPRGSCGAGSSGLRRLRRLREPQARRQQRQRLRAVRLRAGARSGGRAAAEGARPGEDQGGDQEVGEGRRRLRSPAELRHQAAAIGELNCNRVYRYR